MVDGLSIHGLDHANVIRHLGEVGHGLSQLDPARSMPFEFQRGGGDRKACLTGCHGSLAFVGIDRLGHLLAELLMQPRLVVEKIVLRGSSGLEKIDYPLHLGLKVRHVGKTAHRIARTQLVFLTAQQSGQGDGPQAKGRFFEEGAPGIGVRQSVCQVHDFNSGKWPRRG